MLFYLRTLYEPLKLTNQPEWVFIMNTLGMNQVYNNWVKDIDESLANLKMSQTDLTSDFQSKLSQREQKLKTERASLVALLLSNLGE